MSELGIKNLTQLRSLCETSTSKISSFMNGGGEIRDIILKNFAANCLYEYNRYPNVDWIKTGNGEPFKVVYDRESLYELSVFLIDRIEEKLKAENTTLPTEDKVKFILDSYEKATKQGKSPVIYLVGIMKQIGELIA